MQQTGQKEHLTLLKLQALIKSRIEEALPFTFWVAAEISELKVNYSGHCYLELVEKGGANQIPRAKASATIWRSAYGAISAYFRSATGGDLAEGMKVLLKASVSYHELYGLSLNVTDIDPVYTLGDMERQRQETISRLQQEGVYDMNRSLELPSVIQRVAVISSPNAAGYQDFMEEIAAGGYYFDIVLFPAVMQGHETEDSVIDALERISDTAEKFDVAVVIRGGGSQADLAAFDSYRLCSHLAQFPLPVLTGIGHDKDQSVADLVAAVSLKTPTAVAGWLVDSLAGFDGWLDELRDVVINESIAMLDAQKRRLQSDSLSLQQTSVRLTRSMEMRLERLWGEILRRKDNVLMSRINRLERIETVLLEKTYNKIESESARLNMAERMVGGKRPDAILSLGFAIVRSGGRALKRSDEVSAGAQLDITLSRGNITAEVKETK